MEAGRTTTAAPDLDRQTWEITAQDQRLVLYTAVPGTPSHDRLRLLQAVRV